MKLWVDPVDMDEALARVSRFAKEGNRPHSVLAVNPEKNFSVPKDPELWEVFGQADLLIPDGIGVVMAARILYGAEINRTPGVKLMHRICEMAAQDGHKVFIYGAKEEVNAGAAEKLKELYPGIKIVGRSNGYVKDDEQPDLVKKINESGAEILFLALGSPKQEKWFAFNKDKLEHVKVCQGIGGTLDTIAGTVQLAPESWQKLGLEWLYRLIKEPKRLKRQKVLPVFAFLVLWEKIKMFFGGGPARAKE